MRKENQEKSHLSERLKKLIYNPKLPPHWNLFSVREKVKMFRMLFLLLNENFQNEFAGEIEKWIVLYNKLHDENKRFNVIRCKKCKECKSSKCVMISLHAVDICSLLMRESDVAIEGDDFESFSAEGTKLLLAFFNWDYNKFFKHIIDFLNQTGLQEGFPEWAPKGFPNDTKKLKDSINWDKAIADIKNREDSFNDSNFFYKAVNENLDIKEFKTYMKQIKKGNIPFRYFPAVEIYLPKEKLLRDFERFIDKIQKNYFERYPQHKTIDFGHLKQKSDGRKDYYPFDEWERYYKAYILVEEQDMDRWDVAKKLIPTQHSLEHAKDLIDKAIVRARKLLKNAWSGSFPGKYY